MIIRICVLDLTLRFTHFRVLVALAWLKRRNNEPQPLLCPQFAAFLWEGGVLTDTQYNPVSCVITHQGREVIRKIKFIGSWLYLLQIESREDARCSNVHYLHATLLGLQRLDEHERLYGPVLDQRGKLRVAWSGTID